MKSMNVNGQWLDKVLMDKQLPLDIHDFFEDLYKKADGEWKVEIILDY